MRILQIINDLQIGGAQRLLSDLLPLLHRQHDVEVLLLQEKPSSFVRQLCDSGITLHSLNVRSLYNPTTIFRIRRFLQRQPPYDIIHVHLFPALYWVPMAVAGMRQRLVWTEHSTSNRRQQNLMFRYTDRMAYAHYDKLICISQATRDSLESWIGAKNNDPRLCVVENGIDTGKFQHHKREKRAPRTLIQVSRFEASKDQDTVIKAMPQLPPDIQLLLVGDGSRMDECKALCHSLNLQDRVHFLGARADVAQLLSQADIAIQSSHWEGFGLTAVEAMAAGLPVVASDVEGLRQVVKGAGLLFPQGDSETLSRLIIQLLSDEHTYLEVSERCQRRSQQYDIRETAYKYIAIYENTIFNTP